MPSRLPRNRDKKLKGSLTTSSAAVCFVSRISRRCFNFDLYFDLLPAQLILISKSNNHNPYNTRAGRRVMHAWREMQQYSLRQITSRDTSTQYYRQCPSGKRILIVSNGSETVGEPAIWTCLTSIRYLYSQGLANW